jgi:(R,R)-butanediol dehydrogenase/meso-butanediol dehydrogenase/diacetyl reductase
MKAATVNPGAKLEISQVPVPEPGEDELLIEVAYCGVCGSDLHILDTGRLPAGCIMGHELSGRVAAIGSRVDGFSKGDLVVVHPMNPCFSCEPCKSGHTQLCGDAVNRGYGLGTNPGGFAQFMLTKASMLFSPPEGMDMKTAALNEPWAVAVHALNMMDTNPDSVVLVMGAGPIGLMCIYALKMTGVTEIYASEPDGYRAGKASLAGAKEVIDPKSSNPAQVISAQVGRLPDYVIDCVGTRTSTQEAAAIVGTRGVVMVLGVHMDTAEVMPIVCFLKEAQLNFSFAYTYREFADCIETLAGGAVDPEVLISDVMPLSRIGEAFEVLRGSGHSKIMIDCQK